MTFDEVLEQVRELLQSKGRVAYRALKRRFDLDDEYLEDLKAELIDAEDVVGDITDHQVMSWLRREAEHDIELIGRRLAQIVGRHDRTGKRGLCCQHAGVHPKGIEPDASAGIAGMDRDVIAGIRDHEVPARRILQVEPDPESASVDGNGGIGDGLPAGHILKVRHYLPLCLTRRQSSRPGICGDDS